MKTILTILTVTALIFGAVTVETKTENAVQGDCYFGLIDHSNFNEWFFAAGDCDSFAVGDTVTVQDFKKFYIIHD